MGKIDSSEWWWRQAMRLALDSDLIFNMTTRFELMLGDIAPEIMLPAPPTPEELKEMEEEGRISYRVRRVWVLGAIAPKARTDALRLLAKGADPPPLYFTLEGLDAYVSEDRGDFAFPRGRGAGVDVRDQGWLLVRTDDFMKGVLRAFEGERFDDALDPHRHAGLREYLARWTGGPDFRTGPPRWS